MRMYCKNCGKKYYSTQPSGWASGSQGTGWFPRGWNQWLDNQCRVFHSRFCKRVAGLKRNQDEYTNFLQQLSDYVIQDNQKPLTIKKG